MEKLGLLKHTKYFKVLLFLRHAVFVYVLHVLFVNNEPLKSTKGCVKNRLINNLLIKILNIERKI